MSNSRSVYFSQFFHRTNADATIDSICGFCFDTVASVIKEEELRLQEVNHRCSDRKLTEIAEPRRSGIRLVAGRRPKS